MDILKYIISFGVHNNPRENWNTFSIILLIEFRAGPKSPILY